MTPEQKLVEEIETSNHPTPDEHTGRIVSASNDGSAIWSDGTVQGPTRERLCMNSDSSERSSWWKPKGRRRDLVRAAALILAEIERLDRLSGASHASETD